MHWRKKFTKINYGSPNHAEPTGLACTELDWRQTGTVRYQKIVLAWKSKKKKLVRTSLNSAKLVGSTGSGSVWTGSLGLADSVGSAGSGSIRIEIFFVLLLWTYGRL